MSDVISHDHLSPFSQKNKWFFNRDREIEIVPRTFRYFTEIKLGSFVDFTYLTRLSITGNSDSNLLNVSGLRNLSERRLFHGLHNLQTLFLSENGIEILDPMIFAEMQKLIELDISGNKITSLENFPPMKSLTHLHISNNKISEIFPQSFSRLSKLYFLYLKGNKIKRVNFEVPNNLRSLNLSENEISEVENGDFNFPKLEDLYLRKNKLKRIEGWKLHRMQNLKILAIDDNEITEIEPSSFNHLPKLSYLSMMRNPIKDLGGRSLECVSFKTLDISLKGVSRIDKNVLTYCYNLENLRVHYDNNPVSHIDLTSLKKLKELSVYFMRPSEDFDPLGMLDSNAIEEIHIRFSERKRSSYLRDIVLVQEGNIFVETERYLAIFSRFKKLKIISYDGEFYRKKNGKITYHPRSEDRIRFAEV